MTASIQYPIRFRTLMACLLIALASVPLARAFTPTGDVTGCVMWFSADALSANDGDSITNWPDQSGAGNDLVRTGLAFGSAPLYQTNAPGFLNGQPSLSFDLSTLWTEPANPAITVQEMFIVATLASDAESIATMLSLGREGTAPFNEIRRNGPAEGYAADAAFDLGGGADGIIRINGEIGTDITYGTPHIFGGAENNPAIYTNLYLGWNVIWGRPWKGQIAEIIAFDNRLSQTDRNAVNQYLADKYGIAGVSYPAPDTLPVTDGLEMWLNANNLGFDIENGDPVTSWTDSSGKDIVVNRDGLVFGGPPTFQTNAPGVFNGQSTVYFPGNTYIHTAGSDPVIPAQEIYVVATMSGSSESISTMFTIGFEGVVPFNEIRRNGTNEAYANDGSFDFGGGVDGVMRINGQPGSDITFDELHILNANENNPSAYTNFYLGWNPPVGRTWIGNIAEIIIYSNRHTQAQRNAMHTYLAGKYGITNVAVPELAPPPPVTNGLTAWFNAGNLFDFASGDDVTEWADASGNGMDLDRTGLAANAPTFQTNAPGFLNGHPSVFFDGDTIWTEAIDPVFDAQEIFAVVSLADDAEGLATLLSIGAEGFPPFQEIRRDGTNEAYADDAAFDFGGGADGALRVNGIQGTALTFNEPHIFNATETAAMTYTNLYLGYNVIHGRYWKGHVAEILLFDRDLTVDERSEIGIYLADKYDIQESQYRTPDALPPSSGNLTAWYSANDLLDLADGTDVTIWEDRSGNGNNLVRTGLGGPAPVFQTNDAAFFNGRPTVSFNGSAIWTIETNAMPAQEIFAVLTLDSDNDSISTLLSLGAEGFPPFQQVRAFPGTAAYGDDAAFDFGGGVDGTIRIDGAEGTAITLGAPHTYNSTENAPGIYTNLYLGWNVIHGRYWKGQVAELIIYNTALSTGDRESVYDYLNTKYGFIEILDPLAGILTLGPDGAAIDWESLQSGTNYNFEASDDLTNPSGWTILTTFTATNDVVTVNDTNEPVAHRTYRLYKP